MEKGNFRKLTSAKDTKKDAGAVKKAPFPMVGSAVTGYKNLDSDSSNTVKEYYKNIIEEQIRKVLKDAKTRNKALSFDIEKQEDIERIFVNENKKRIAQVVISSKGFVFGDQKGVSEYSFNQTPDFLDKIKNSFK